MFKLKQVSLLSVRAGFGRLTGNIDPAVPELDRSTKTAKRQLQAQPPPLHKHWPEYQGNVWVCCNCNMRHAELAPFSVSECMAAAEDSRGDPVADWKAGAMQLRAQGETNGHELVWARPLLFCLNCAFYGTKAKVSYLLKPCNPAKPAVKRDRIFKDLEAGFRPFTQQPVGRWQAPSLVLVREMLHAEGAKVDTSPLPAVEPDQEVMLDPFEAAAGRAEDLKLVKLPKAGLGIPAADGPRVLPPLPRLPPPTCMRRARFRF